MQIPLNSDKSLKLLQKRNSGKIVRLQAVYAKFAENGQFVTKSGHIGRKMRVGTFIARFKA